MLKFRQYALLAALLTLVGGLAGYPLKAQVGQFQSVVTTRLGTPAPGALVSVCQGLTITAVTVTSNVATATLATNPIAAGFIMGQTIVNYNFTGNDSYLNGTFVITSLSTSQIQFAVVAANGSATSPGLMVQQGTSTTTCLPLATIYTDNTGSHTQTQPLVSDGLGNVSIYASQGTYQIQYSGSSFLTRVFTTMIAASSIAPPITVPGINCNGLADNTAVLNTFFASLSTSATNVAHVLLPPGICMVKANVLVPDFTWVQGSGKRQTVIKQISGTNDAAHPIITFSASSGGVNNGGTNITFSDFTVDGNAAGQSTGLRNLGNSSGFVSSVYAYNMRFINGWQAGIFLFDFTSTGNNTDTGVWDSDFENNAPSQGSSTLDQQCSTGDIIIFHPVRTRIVNNRSEGTNGDFACTPGGAVQNSFDVVIAANVVHGALGFGVGLGTFGQNASITGNIFNMPNSRQNIIDIGDFGFVTVTGNTVNSGNACTVGCGSVGDGPPANHVTITGNTFVGTASVNNVCMTLGSSDILISGNICRASGGSGILFSIPAGQSASHITITGNSVSDSGLSVANHPGIEMFLGAGAAIADFVITGNHLFDDQGPKTQGYGVGIAQFGQTTGFGTFLVADNDVRGNLLNGIIDNSVAPNSGIGPSGYAHIIRGNPGFDTSTDAAIDSLFTANTGFSTAYTFPANVNGSYLVTWEIILSRAATTSSTLPSITFAWTDARGGVGSPALTFAPVSASANTSGAVGSGSFMITPTSSSGLAYQTTGYASVGGTTMQYAVVIRVTKVSY